MQRDINFFENYEHTVSFMLDEQEFTGVLTIGRANIPTLKLHTNDHSLIFVDQREIEYPIVCRVIGSITTFTLYGNEIQRGGTVISEFVSTGKEMMDDLNQIELHLTGLSTWVEGMRSSEITETEYKRSIISDNFSVDFNFNKQDYSIKNHRHVSPFTLSSTNHSFEIQDCLILTKRSGVFSLEEVKRLTLEIRNLFSLLLGHSLSIKHLYLMSSLERHRFQSLVFPSVMYDEHPLEHYQVLCHFVSVCQRDLWDSIIQNYFQVKSFRTIWNRLVTSLYDGYSTIWEYDILSVVVTLEMYCEQESKGQGHKLHKTKYNELKSHLTNTLKMYVDDTELSEEDMLVIAGFEVALGNLRNTSHPTLQHKYDFLMAKTSNEIQEAISFSDSDFLVLKKLRNSVAHGLKYNTVVEGEISKEMQLRDRLLTLLMYFVFYEMGFSDKQIARSFGNTHHKKIIHAGGNERARDKLAETARFIDLAEHVDLSEYGSFEHIVIEYNANSETYMINKTLSIETKQNWHGSGVSDVRDFIRGKVTGKEMEYVPKIYLTSGEDKKCYYGAILLSQW
ncbi:hypothetical protein AB4331_03555 [Vibrio breoganii]